MKFSPEKENEEVKTTKFMVLPGCGSISQKINGEKRKFDAYELVDRYDVNKVMPIASTHFVEEDQSYLILPARPLKDLLHLQSLRRHWEHGVYVADSVFKSRKTLKAQLSDVRADIDQKADELNDASNVIEVERLESELETLRRHRDALLKALENNTRVLDQAIAAWRSLERSINETESRLAQGWLTVPAHKRVTSDILGTEHLTPLQTAIGETDKAALEVYESEQAVKEATAGFLRVSREETHKQAIELLQRCLQREQRERQKEEAQANS